MWLMPGSYSLLPSASLLPLLLLIFKASLTFIVPCLPHDDLGCGKIVFWAHQFVDSLTPDQCQGKFAAEEASLAATEIDPQSGGQFQHFGSAMRNCGAP